MWAWHLLQAGSWGGGGGGACSPRKLLDFLTVNEHFWCIPGWNSHISARLEGLECTISVTVPHHSCTCGIDTPPSTHLLLLCMCAHLFKRGVAYRCQERWSGKYLLTVLVATAL